MSYFFDTLPVHSQPKSLESLTGYLLRLADVNGLRTLKAMYDTFFPYRIITRPPADYPLLTLDTLPAVTQCSESKLLTTTFYHLGKKFGRAANPHSMSRFLSGSLAE